MRPLTPGDPARIGQYELEGRLGTGGMGTVYLGRSPGGRPAAIKVINAGLESDPEALLRFQREAEILRTVRNAYTAALIDCELTTPPYWMVTEYIPGPTLAAGVADQGPLSVEECFRLAGALAEGLADIHALGICHRDLKPQNIILSATGPRLIDFGLARGLAEFGLTESGIVIGTAGYAAPESMAGEELTPAADVFALGATVAHAATGRRPYGSGPIDSVYLRCSREDIDVAGIDPELATLIQFCVARDPQQRPSLDHIIEWCRDRRLANRNGGTAGNAVASIPGTTSTASDAASEPVVAGGLSAQRDSGASPARPGAGAPAVDPVADRPAEPPVRRRRLLVVLGSVVAALVLVGGGAMALTRSGDGSNPVAAGADVSSAPNPACPGPPNGTTGIGTGSQISDCVGSPMPSSASSSTTPSSGSSTTQRRRSPTPARKPPRSSSTAKPPTGSPAQKPASGGRTIVGLGGKCVDVNGNDIGGNGAYVQLWACQSYADDQRWTKNADSSLETLGRCLDINGNGRANGTKVGLWSCNGVGGQKWVFRANGSLFNPQSQRCLDVPDSVTADGTRLRIWDCNGTPAQKFSFG